MGMIINIADALKNRADYNILREPINDMLKNKQEAFEKKNPIDLLFKRGTINKFQETYTSSIGFAHAFAETGDYAVAPIFNTHEGFSKVYTTRTFQGGFIITQQVLEDQAYNTIKNTASQFITRWHGDTVEYAMKAISAGFGQVRTFGDESNGGESQLQLTSADTVTGSTIDPVKNPLFTNGHTIVKRKGMTVADIRNALQSNAFSVYDGSTYGIDLDGNDPGKVAKLADVINQVITIQENYKDDNNKYAGVQGAKRIVAPNDARLLAMLNSALDMPMFNDIGQKLGPNPAYKRATVEVTPYLRDLECCFDAATQRAVGFFIVDPAYNSENSGPEFTERVALTLNVDERKNPYGIAYDARQRFDINVASWRGIVYVYIGSATPSFISVPSLKADGTTEIVSGFNALTPITPISTIVMPVAVTNTVKILDTTPSEPEPDTVTVSFDANGGSGTRAPLTGIAGGTIILPNSTGLTPPENKVFIGWDTEDDAESATYAAGDAYTLSANVTLYAIWDDAT
jgi:hypothetical protein